MRDSSPVRTLSLYGAVGLLDDPFPRDPQAGSYVPLTRQTTVLAGVRDWLGSTGDGAPGLAVVAGEAGSGKTRLLEQLVLAIADDDRLIVVVPDDGAIVEADRRGVAPLDMAPQAPAVQALSALAERLVPV